METQKKETKQESFELRCDSSHCWKCSESVCEEHSKDLVLSAGA